MKTKKEELKWLLISKRKIKIDFWKKRRFIAFFENREDLIFRDFQNGGNVWLKVLHRESKASFHFRKKKKLKGFLLVH